MTTFPAVAAFFILRAVHVGSLRMTPYGLCAAAGLLLGMSLARRTARRARLDPEAGWDAGLFALVSCLVASRLLLVLRDPRAFARYPLLVLSLPSLTFAGMAVAAILLWFYLRRKRLALPALLDAYAAPGAVLASFLELGHALDGSEVGMPSAVPWAVQEPSAATVRVHPVAAYGIIGSLALAALLWRMLSSRNLPPGRVAAVALLAGGALAYSLNLLTQPLMIPDGFWLEPGQWLALASILTGALLWLFPARSPQAQPGLTTLPLIEPLTTAPEPQKELHACPQRT